MTKKTVGSAGGRLVLPRRLDDEYPVPVEVTISSGDTYVVPQGVDDVIAGVGKTPVRRTRVLYGGDRDRMIFNRDSRHFLVPATREELLEWIYGMPELVGGDLQKFLPLGAELIVNPGDLDKILRELWDSHPDPVSTEEIIRRSLTLPSAEWMPEVDWIDPEPEVTQDRQAEMNEKRAEDWRKRGAAMSSIIRKNAENAVRAERDPAVLAIRRMLGRLFESDAARSVVGQDGMAIGLVLPDVTWQDLAVENWSVFVFPGAGIRMRGSKAYLSGTGVEKEIVHGTASVLRKDSGHRNGLIPTLEKRLVDWISNRKNVVVTIEDPEDRIPALDAVLDTVLELEPLRSSDLTRVALSLYGVTSESGLYDLNQDIVDLITPEILQLAQRDWIDAVGYLRRVEEITKAAYIDVPQRLLRQPRKRAPEVPRWTLDNLHGMGPATLWGRQLCVDLADYKSGRLDWCDVDRGALLVGPPGVGKTTFAKALAASAGVPLVASSYSDLEAGSEGKSRYNDILPRLKQLFAGARRSAPCIIFLDEIDSFRARGSSDHNESWFSTIVNALLAELDGARDREGVVVIGATNHLNLIDPAMRRPGRLDRTIEISLPDEPGIRSILGELLREDGVGIDLGSVSRRLVGRSGADCELLVRTARRTARASQRSLEQGDLLAALKDGSRRQSERELWHTAVHEAGHALVAMQLKPQALVSVGILPRGPTVGSTDFKFGSEETGELEDIERTIQVLLAGRAADVVLLGRPTIGSSGLASSDLARATVMSAAIEVEWGIGEMGISWRGDVNHSNIGQLLAFNKELAKRVEERLQRLHSATEELILANRNTVLAIADNLTTCEVLSASEVRAIMIEHQRLPVSSVTAPSEFCPVVR